MSLAINIRVMVDPALVSSPEELSALYEKLNDFSPVLEEAGGVGDIIDDALAENFLTRGYGGWAPLAPSTVKERERLGYGGQPDLYRTGDLFGALTSRDSPDHKFLVSRSGIIVGAYTDRLSYISALANGSPARNLPARVLIRVLPEHINLVVQAIAEWLGQPGAVTVFADAPIET